MAVVSLMDNNNRKVVANARGHGLKLVKPLMVEELGVTLHDFMPISGHLIRISSGTVVISPRLQNRLRDYAARRRISLVQALERLRDEVQKAP